MTDASRIQVGIIGGGPAGLLLSQILHLKGINSVILERQSREYVMSRIRAGVPERGMVDLLRKAEVAKRLEKEALRHEGLDIAFGSQRHRIDLADLTDNRDCVYGQTEITKDLYSARDAMGGVIVDEAENVTPCDVATDAPYLTYKRWPRASPRLRLRRRIR